MVFNNALNANQQGTQYLSTAGAWSGVDAGAAGNLLTSNGTGIAPSFQAASGTGIVQTITGNSGGALSPTAGNINTIGTGSITVAGSGSTLTAQLTGLTNHAVLIGAGTATITSVGPVASTGNVLMSNGVSADPGFSTATYPITTTSQQILYSTAANVVGQLTTANSALAATNATGVLGMRAFIVNSQVFTSSGTFTPTTGMLYCIIECHGSGAGGGGSATANVGSVQSAGGGGAGSYSKITSTAATIGASQTVTVGNAGTGGTAGNNAGTAGADVSVGTICIGKGGSGGGGAATGAAGTSGAGGVVGTGSLTTVGNNGGQGTIATILTVNIMAGLGASSIYGGSPGPAFNNTTLTGAAANVYGAGGNGAISGSAGNVGGGNGSKGIVYITEFIIN